MMGTRARQKGVWANRTPNPKIHYVSAAAASREYGAHRTALNGWLYDNRLRSYCHIEKRRLMVPVEYVERWAAATGRSRHLEVRTPKAERLTSKEAIRILGCSRLVLHTGMKKGLLRRYRSGCTFYYLRDEVLNYKREHLTRPPSWKVELPRVASRLGVGRTVLTKKVRRQQYPLVKGWSPYLERHTLFIDVTDAEKILGEPWQEVA